jgi:hypothetical protein
MALAGLSERVVLSTGAGALYALIVFFIGFILGTIRVLLVLPLLGETAAILLETPLILAASWYGCRWIVERLDVPRTLISQSIMGAVAFATLMLSELAFAVLVFGRPLAEQFNSYATGAAEFGFVAQVIFAVFPVIQVWRR